MMNLLVEMKSNPANSVSSLPKGSVYRGVHLSGEINPELSELQKAMVDSTIKHMDKMFSALQKSPLSDFSVLNYKTWPPKNNAEEFMNRMFVVKGTIFDLCKVHLVLFNVFIS